MQVSLPSKRRAVRFLFVFYAATALLFFGFFAVLGIFDPFSLFTIWASALWPIALMPNGIHATLLLIGLVAALAESRITEVDS